MSFYIMVQEYWETLGYATQFDEEIIKDFLYKFIKERLTKEDLVLIKEGVIPLE